VARPLLVASHFPSGEKALAFPPINSLENGIAEPFAASHKLMNFSPVPATILLSGEIATAVKPGGVISLVQAISSDLRFHSVRRERVSVAPANPPTTKNFPSGEKAIESTRSSMPSSVPVSRQ
jgi:hypothetical protein